jgi:hypothetical protein
MSTLRWGQAHQSPNVEVMDMPEHNLLVILRAMEIGHV